MRSSTSSFERAVPPGRWGATWVVALVVAAVVVVRFELFVRARGYQPSIKDDEYAWTWERAKVSTSSPRTVAVLGSSRVLLGFSGAAFTETLPGWTYAQLGVLGSTPIGTLLDLARDPSFKGVAIVEVSEYAFYQISWTSQDKYVDAYQRRWREVGAMLERALATEVQSRVATLATRGIGTFGKWLENGEWPVPPHVVTYADRTRYADFSLVDVERQRQNRREQLESFEKTSRDPAPWLADAALIEPAIAQIQARGGQVVYLRMPTCAERWEADERMFPKARFWDVLARRTRAITIHFKDHPELARLQCPDISHLDGKDAPRFTRTVLAILRDRGVFAR